MSAPTTVADLFKPAPPAPALSHSFERALIQRAQYAPDSNAGWLLLAQYRGALKSAYNIVVREARSLSPEQLEDLQADLVAEAFEVIRTFDLSHPIEVRLAAVLPRRLKHVATSKASALFIPRSVLARWFAIYRHATEDGIDPATFATKRGMTADTYRAIEAALDFDPSEWVDLPYNAGREVADSQTHRLAHLALSVLTPVEREVIELAYGFRGDPKSDQEVADLRGTSRSTVSTLRTRALAKMHDCLVPAPAQLDTAV